MTQKFIQEKITSTNMLSADLVDDTTTVNKFTTSTEKSTWNSKQNAISLSSKLSSDLVDATGHTNQFVTSAEKSTWNGKQSAIPNEYLDVVPVNASLTKSNQDSATKVYKTYTWTLASATSGYPVKWVSQLSDDFKTRTFTVYSNDTTVLRVYTFDRTLDSDGNLLTEVLKTS